MSTTPKRPIYNHSVGQLTKTPFQKRQQPLTNFKTDVKSLASNFEPVTAVKTAAKIPCLTSRLATIYKPKTATKPAITPGITPHHNRINILHNNNNLKTFGSIYKSVNKSTIKPVKEVPVAEIAKESQEAPSYPTTNANIYSNPTNLYTQNPTIIQNPSNIQNNNWTIGKNKTGGLINHTTFIANSRSGTKENERSQVRTQAPPRTPAATQYQIFVNDKRYQILRKIGTGGSAKVYAGYEPLTSETYAIKIINIAKADDRSKESYFNEISILKQLSHSKYVVQLIDSEFKKQLQELIIVMELGSVDLSRVIDSHFKQKDRNGTRMIEDSFIKYYWRRMLQAVDYIHQNGIIHADLKPVNFILVENEIKIIDFGIANAIEPEEGTSIIRDFQIGTINYMAPEALRNRAGDASFRLDDDNCDKTKDRPKTVIKYNSKVDIWSLGCILYNLVCGRPPFDKITDTYAKIQAITNPNHQIDFPQLSNQNLLISLKSCLKYHPIDRPSAKELLGFPFLREDRSTIEW